MSGRLNLDDWFPWYDRIAAVFGYDRSSDQYAADVLSALLARGAVDLEELRALISGRPVLVLGAGPSLEEDLGRISSAGLLRRCVIISADGATSALLKSARIAPGVVVTDLDGIIPDLLTASRSGSISVLHAHGDNIDLLKEHVPKFRRALGTTQVEPRPNVHNFGGFTDGDRAVFLAVAMGAKLIALAGMDLGSIIGRYSKRKPSSLEVKRRKLKFCKELLEWLASRVDIELFNVTRHGEEIKGFENTTPRALRKIVSR